MTKAKKVLCILAILTAILVAVGLWYRRGQSLYDLNPYPMDMPTVCCQVFSGGDSRALTVDGGLAGVRISDAVEQLTFHRAASNLITQPLGLWRHPDLEVPADEYAFTLEFQGSVFVLRLCFSQGQWYYQNPTMEGYLPCAASPNGVQAGEELGALLWEMAPTWEKYEYN